MGLEDSMIPEYAGGHAEPPRTQPNTIEKNEPAAKPLE